uniref:Ig-like domain-containing protein n=1 Tax=Leptobrachium leishanense TaxID=445787 RepID=A0A8C5P9R2_9ANUR
MVLILRLEIIHCQKDFVIQEPVVQTEHEGQSVTLKCRYETAFSAYMFWYRQKPGQSLEFLARADTEGTDYVVKEYQSRVSIKLHKNNKTCPLSLTGALVEDAAVYHCALRPTATCRHTSPYKNSISL